MTDQHPINPPPELFKQWEGMPRSLAFEAAYRAGADQELEACCDWMSNRSSLTEQLRAARRPKPPSLSEQALAEIQEMEGAMYSADLGCDFTATRRALERLQELEGAND